MNLPDRIIQAVSEVVHQPVNPDTDLHTLGDGLLYFEVLDRIEQDHDLEISDHDAERIKTVRDLIDHVGLKLGEPV